MTPLRATTTIALCAVFACTSAAAAGPDAVPVVRRLTGVVQLNSAQAGTHELASTELLASSTVIATDKAGSASIELSGVGVVRVGGSAQLTADVANGRLYVMPQHGMACIETQHVGIVVRIAGYDIEPQTPSVIETAANSRSGAFGVIEGGVNVSTGTTRTYVPQGGSYVIVAVNGFIHAAPPMPTSLGAWHCP